MKKMNYYVVDITEGILKITSLSNSTAWSDFSSIFVLIIYITINIYVNDNYRIYSNILSIRSYGKILNVCKKFKCRSKNEYP